MWARIVEVCLAAFLCISTWIFPDPRPFWILNFCLAAWICVFSFLSFYPPLRKIHLMNGIPILILCLVAMVQPNPPPPPLFQSYMTLALLLVLFVIIPTHASRPPDPWVHFYNLSKDDHGH
ncbi:MAG: hypothetical protein KDK64_05255 [Chlamydiia bacterium]|nr:hypothetical protein [Chlamydiia bacterium]